MSVENPEPISYFTDDITSDPLSFQETKDAVDGVLNCVDSKLQLKFLTKVQEYIDILKSKAFRSPQPFIARIEENLLNAYNAGADISELHQQVMDEVPAACLYMARRIIYVLGSSSIVNVKDLKMTFQQNIEDARKYGADEEGLRVLEQLFQQRLPNT